MGCPQYSIRLEEVGYLCTSSLPAFDHAYCHVSDSIVNGNWLPATEWCQRCLPCCQPASDVAENLGFLVRSAQAREWLWIESNRNPVEGYFGSTFPAICNHCWVMAAGSRKTLKILRNFCRLKKRSLKVRFSKFCSKCFRRDTDQCVVFKFREIWPTRNQWNRALLTLQKMSLGSPDVSTARIAPKICKASPRQRTWSAPDFIQIGSLSAEL